MFDEDARLASRELDLTLTTRDRGKDKEEQTPMCGVPYHSSDSYIARLVAKGYKVAICEQMEDPALAKGLVKRDIVRIVTPGTVTESTMLEESRNNYYACICRSGESWGVCFCDISTGAFYATSARGTDAEEAVCNELGSFSPVEVLLGGGADDGEMLKGVLQERLHCCVNHGDSVFEYEACERLVCEQFGKASRSLAWNPSRRSSRRRARCWRRSATRRKTRFRTSGSWSFIWRGASWASALRRGAISN